MQTLYKSSNGINTIPLETSLFSSRKIFLEGEITQQSACEFLKQLMYLVNEDRSQPVHIYIDSIGGSVTSGLLIYDCIKSVPCKINLYCIDIAASMAAIILAGGPKGHRFILPHSKCVIHEPLISDGLSGSATSIQKTAESIMETKRLTASLLSADTGKPIKEVE